MSRNHLSLRSTKGKAPVMTLPICKGVTRSGKRCSYRGRHHGYCKIHAHPDYVRDLTKKLGDCPICYEKITKKSSMTTRCKHVFHKTCLERWMEEKTTCPMCRDDIRPTTGQLRPRAQAEAIARAEAAGMPNMASVIARQPPPVSASREPRRVVMALGTFVNQNELDNFLVSVRNAPIDISFTGNFWESN